MKNSTLLYALFLLLLVALIISGSKCTSDAAAVDAHKAQESRLIVALDGQYAYQESANAFVDGQSIGVVTSGGSQYIRVDEGNHVVSATTVNVPQTFTNTVLVKANTFFTYNVPCEPGKATVSVEGLYAADNTKIHVYIQGVQRAVIAPGESETIVNIQPSIDVPFVFKDDSGKIRYSLTKTILYKSTNSVFVPYQ